MSSRLRAKARTIRTRCPKLRRFLEIAVEYKPVNLGDARHGGALRPSRSMNPLSHWKRDITPDFQAVIEGWIIPPPAPRSSTIGWRPRISSSGSKKEDLGLSVNVSTSIDGAEQCCHHACIPRHSVGYSLGFEGKTEKLPNSQRADAFDDVRPRDGQPFAGEEDDRLGEGRPPHSGRGRDVTWRDSAPAVYSIRRGRSESSKTPSRKTAPGRRINQDRQSTKFLTAHPESETVSCATSRTTQTKQPGR